MDRISNYRNLDQQQFFDLLRELDEYYTNEQPLVEDQIYNFLYDYYQENFGPYEEIGAPPRGEAVPLPYPMPSLDKYKTQDKIDKFASKYPGDYLVEDKIDGLSVMYVPPVNGQPAKLYTRGGGVAGEDRSFLLPYLTLPNLEQYPVVVRGEIVIPRQAFEQYGEMYARALNMTSGIVMSKKENFDPDLARLLKFYAYRTYNVSKELTPIEERMLLSQLGFSLPCCTVVSNLDQKQLIDYYLKRNQQAEYDMDGLVIYANLPLTKTTDNPKTAFALKPPTETAVVTVTEVNWKPSRNRRINPTVSYTTTWLSGGNLTNATIHNARFVFDNGIGPGAVIRIVRSGTTIPAVLEVISPSPEPVQYPPYKCKWDDNEVFLIALEDTPEVVTDRIVHFLSTLGIKTFGEGRIAKLVEAGVRNLDDFLSLTPQQVSNLEGFKNLPETFFADLWQTLSSVKLSVLANASGFFPAIGPKRWADIIETFPNLLQWNPYNRQDIIDKISQVRGISSLATVVADNLPAFFEWLSRWPAIKIVSEAKKVSGILSGRVFVFTGVRDGEMIDKLRSLGAEVREGVSRTTTDLIYAKPGTGSYNKAVQYGMNLHSYSNFKKQLASM